MDNMATGSVLFRTFSAGFAAIVVLCFFLPSPFGARVIFAEAKLLKVIALARHGNRNPNAQAEAICPKAAPFVFDAFKTEYAKQKAALSRVGLAECQEAGKWLRKRYIEDKEQAKEQPLVSKTFYDTEETFFYSERMDRNVVSLHALVNFGFYPPGTGVTGFAKSDPNVVPILTAPAFHDTIMNLPRDGPCKPVYKEDKSSFDAAAFLTKDAREVIDEFGKQACGIDFFNPAQSHAPKDIQKKEVAWTLKNAADMMNFARNEGIAVEEKFFQNDPTLLDSVISISSKLTNAERFGKPHQLTYWLGDFYKQVLLPNFLTVPDEDKRGKKKETLEIPGVALNAKHADWSLSPTEFFFHQKLLVFMNHREFLTAFATVLGIDFGVTKPLPSGSMLVLELHEVENENTAKGDEEVEKEHYIKFFAWTPSKPSFAKKHEYLTTGQPMEDLYAFGNAEPVFPRACRDPEGKCSLADIERAFGDLMDKTGTWEEVCNVRTTSSSSSSALLSYATNLVEEHQAGDDEEAASTRRKDKEKNTDASQEQSSRFGGWEGAGIFFCGMLLSSLFWVTFFHRVVFHYAVGPVAVREVDGLASLRLPFFQSADTQQNI
ncbi:unnamed protein product [Amoebophrya sp. A120]|nr:unnamed protein product [Amoebophrya sp. A120]|eukprot:GSA120T00012865001.1